jgi:hypothetical protein
METRRVTVCAPTASTSWLMLLILLSEAEVTAVKLMSAALGVIYEEHRASR